MKRLIVLAIIILTPQFFAQNNSINDFRNASWGMNLAQVKASESLTPDDYFLNTLFYTDKIASLPANILYHFIDDQLVDGTYIIKEIHITNELYVNDFNNLKLLLTEKYGKPQVDKEKWLVDTFKSDKIYLNMAIGMGHVVYNATWMLPNTIIMLSLSGKEGKAELSIMYQSTKHSELIKNELNSSLKDGF